MTQHRVSASGINNNAWVADGCLYLGDLKIFGKTDTLVIPIRRIDMLKLNRRGAGKDVLTVVVGGSPIEFKSKTAEDLMTEIVAVMREPDGGRSS